MKEAINNGTTRIDMAGKNVSVLVFADDVALISKNTTTAHEQLTMLRGYLTQQGMKLVTRKCSIFQIKTSNKTWYSADPKLQVGPKYHTPTRRKS
jgi:nicotinamide mononucleotide adenylyltransferase